MRSWTEPSVSPEHAEPTTVFDGLPRGVRPARALRRPTESISSSSRAVVSSETNPTALSPRWNGDGDVLGRGDPVPGTPYVIRRCIGEGGMGEVYEAEHRELGRRCALKVLHRHHASRADLAARTRREARSLARLRHPNLVDVFDLGVTADGRPYFAMELLAGRDLRAELTRLGVLAVPTALDVVAQALDALACVHAAGIVHRDIKLENLFLCDSGAVKILDLGVAKLLDDGPVPSRRGLVGTPRTMAPEQCALGEVDRRADLYAAGLVLYELIAGRGPFDNLDEAQALRFAHCVRPAPRPSELAPQRISPDVDAAVARAIAKSPADRFQTATEMADALRALRGERRRRRAPPPRALETDTGDRAKSPRNDARLPNRGLPAYARALMACAVILSAAALALAFVTAVRSGRDAAPSDKLRAPPAASAL